MLPAIVDRDCICTEGGVTGVHSLAIATANYEADRRIVRKKLKGPCAVNADRR